MKHFYQDIPGWFGFEPIYRKALTLARDGGRFVEVGSWKGRSAAFMAVELINSGKDVAFWCVDTWDPPDEPWYRDDPDVKGKRLFSAFLENTSRVGDRINTLQMTSVAAAAVFSDRSLDFVFIDGTHTYEAVKADIAAWLPKIRRGGVIAGDDYNWGGVADAVTELLGPHQVIGQGWWFDVV